MKKALVCGRTAAALIVSPAHADGDEHNCAGTFVSAGAGLDFGSVVSGAAHAQVVDNFNLANCGDRGRKNP